MTGGCLEGLKEDWESIGLTLTPNRYSTPKSPIVNTPDGMPFKFILRDDGVRAPPESRPAMA
jgi:hypothetical protein